MPAALVIHKNTTPHVINAATEDDLLARLQALSTSPELDSISAADSWLATLERPSAIYATVNDAKQAVKKHSQARDAELLRAAQQSLGMTARELAAALAYSDSPPWGTPIRKVTSGNKAMSAGTRRLLAYVLKYGPMSQAEENDLLEELRRGK